MSIKAVYPGSFDPVTYGHMNVVEQAAPLVDELILGIGINEGKVPVFSLEERRKILKAVTDHLENVTVKPFRGMTVDFCRKECASVMIRGLRDENDARSEMSLARENRRQAPEIRTVFIPADSQLVDVSSSATKAILEVLGDVSNAVPMTVKQALESRKFHRYYIGVTGESGSGKSTITAAMAQQAEAEGIPVHHIDMDKLGHDILGKLMDPLYIETRENLVAEFGEEIKQDDGFIDRKVLGAKVFGNPGNIEKLNGIMEIPMLTYLRNEKLLGKTGLIVLDAALIAETGWSEKVNHNVVLVDAEDEVKEERLNARDGITDDQVQRRRGSQLTAAKKRDIIMSGAKEDGNGRVIDINNTDREIADVANETLTEVLNTVDIFGELRIESFFKRLGAKDPKALYEKIRAYYSKVDIPYHSVPHIVNGLNYLWKFKDKIPNFDAVVFAWLFHDVVYDPQTTDRDNEGESAAIAVQMAQELGLNPKLQSDVMRLILATKHNSAPERDDEKWLVDIDLAVLGAEEKEFDEYDEDIRVEYMFVSHELYQLGRRAILQQFKDRGENLFSTPEMRGLLNERAHANLDRAIERCNAV